MTLGDCIKEYRNSMDLSQRQFAEMCGLSNAYISILEKNINPKTGEAPAPTYGVFKKIADAMGIKVQDLMEKADSLVSIGSKMTFDTGSHPWHSDIVGLLKERAEDTQDKKLLSLFNAMIDSDKDKLLDYAQYIVDSYKRPDKRRK